MKKLPEIYKDSTVKKIINNQEYDYCSKTSYDEDLICDKSTIEDKINDIFNDIGYSFNIPVIISTSSKVYDTSLIGRRGNYIITMDGDLIDINNIINIQNKKS